MNRYFSSFFITTFLYIILISAYLYSLNNTKIITSQATKSEQTVKFTVIQEEKPKPKPIVKEKPKTKPKEKIIEKYPRKNKKKRKKQTK